MQCKRGLAPSPALLVIEVEEEMAGGVGAVAEEEVLAWCVAQTQVFLLGSILQHSSCKHVTPHPIPRTIPAQCDEQLLQC